MCTSILTESLPPADCSSCCPFYRHIACKKKLSYFFCFLCEPLKSEHRSKFYRRVRGSPTLQQNPAEPSSHMSCGGWWTDAESEPRSNSIETDKRVYRRALYECMDNALHCMHALQCIALVFSCILCHSADSWGLLLAPDLEWDVIRRHLDNNLYRSVTAEPIY